MLFTTVGPRNNEVDEIWGRIENKIKNISDGEPIILVGHSGGKKIIEEVAQRIRERVYRTKNDHKMYVIAVNGIWWGHGKDRIAPGVTEYTIVTDDDFWAMKVFRLWSWFDPDEKRVTSGGPLTHTPALCNEDVVRITNTWISDIYQEAEIDNGEPAAHLPASPRP